MDTDIDVDVDVIIEHSREHDKVTSKNQRSTSQKCVPLNFVDHYRITTPIVLI